MEKDYRLQGVLRIILVSAIDIKAIAIEKLEKRLLTASIGLPDTTYMLVAWLFERLGNKKLSDCDINSNVVPKFVAALQKRKIGKQLLSGLVKLYRENNIAPSSPAEIRWLRVSFEFGLDLPSDSPSSASDAEAKSAPSQKFQPPSEADYDSDVIITAVVKHTRTAEVKRTNTAVVKHTGPGTWSKVTKQDKAREIPNPPPGFSQMENNMPPKSEKTDPPQRPKKENLSHQSFQIPPGQMDFKMDFKVDVTNPIQPSENQQVKQMGKKGPAKQMDKKKPSKKPANKNWGSTPSENYVCNRCGDRGHFLHFCPTNLDPAYDTFPGPDYQCVVCGVSGQHWRTLCPKNTERNSLTQQRRAMAKQNHPGNHWSGDDGADHRSSKSNYGRNDDSRDKFQDNVYQHGRYDESRCYRPEPDYHAHSRHHGGSYYAPSYANRTSDNVSERARYSATVEKDMEERKQKEEESARKRKAYEVPEKTMRSGRLSPYDYRGPSASAGVVSWKEKRAKTGDDAKVAKQQTWSEVANAGHLDYGSPQKLSSKFFYSLAEEVAAEAYNNHRDGIGLGIDLSVDDPFRPIKDESLDTSSLMASMSVREREDEETVQKVIQDERAKLSAKYSSMVMSWIEKFDNKTVHRDRRPTALDMWNLTYEVGEQAAADMKMPKRESPDLLEAQGDSLPTQPALQPSRRGIPNFLEMETGMAIDFPVMEPYRRGTPNILKMDHGVVLNHPVLVPSKSPPPTRFEVDPMVIDDYPAMPGTNRNNLVGNGASGPRSGNLSTHGELRMDQGILVDPNEHRTLLEVDTASVMSIGSAQDLILVRFPPVNQ